MKTGTTSSVCLRNMTSSSNAHYLPGRIVNTGELSTGLAVRWYIVHRSMTDLSVFMDVTKCRASVPPSTSSVISKQWTQQGVEPEWSLSAPFGNVTELLSPMNYIF